MEPSHRALALKNKRALRQTNDIVLTSMQKDLISFVGGFRHLFDMVLKDHANLTIDDHHTLFRKLEAANKKYKKDHNTIKTEGKSQNKSEKLKTTLHSLNVDCSSEIFNYLANTDYFSLQASCIDLYIAGSRRGSFLSNQDMINYKLFPHLSDYAKGLQSNEDGIIIKSLESLFTTFQKSKRCSIQFCQSGYLPSLIDLGITCKKKNIVQHVLSCLFFLTDINSNIRILTECNAFDLVKKSFDNIMNNSVVTNQALLRSMTHFLHFNLHFAGVARSIGIFDALISALAQWDKHEKTLIKHALLTLNWFIPKQCDYSQAIQLKNEQIAQQILEIVIKKVKQIDDWIQNDDWNDLIVMKSMAEELVGCLQLIHERHIKLDFVKLNVKKVLINIINLLTAAIHHFDISCAKIILALIQMDWSFYLICGHWLLNMCNNCRDGFESDTATRICSSLLSAAVDQKNTEMSTMLCNEPWIKIYINFADTRLLFQYNNRIECAITMFLSVNMNAWDRNNTGNVNRMSDILDCLRIKATKLQFAKLLMKNEQFMAQLFELQKHLKPSFGDIGRNGFQLISIYIGLLAKIHSFCKVNTKGNDMVMSACKSIVIACWLDREYFLDYLERNAAFTNNLAIVILIGNSLTVADESVKILIGENGWLVKSILNQAMQYEQGVGLRLVHDIVTKCDDDSLIRKLMELDFIKYLNWFLSQNISRIIDIEFIIGIVNSFFRVDKSVMDKIPLLKVRLDAISKQYTEVEIPRSIKEFMSKHVDS